MPRKSDINKEYSCPATDNIPKEDPEIKKILAKMLGNGLNIL